MSIRIIGTGSYVPEKILTNDDLSELVDTSDEWITQRVGVKQRHVSVNETTADLAVKAAQRAVEAAGITADELDLIVTATVSADSLCPSTAALVQAAIGAKCPAFDVSSACSGFLFALDTAAAFVARGGIRHALVIGAERLSRIVNWTDRSTCVIFGDGAGAAVVAPGDNYLVSHLFTQGNDDVISIPAGPGNSPFYEREEPARQINMKGQETFKFAVRRIADDIRLVTAKAGITPEQLKYIVPHQANSRIIDLAARKLGVPMEKFRLNIDRYGNTSSASVAISLDELVRSGELQPGDLIALCAFGGGLSSAACVIRW
ncbi:MAG: ketoacyl-ACP synthase III [Oscillospiraceae bacterium]|nr:ketoacyl-ACP synthase III [Oscillospiraceae bacterium]MCR5307268.1 ketoacyl-ACP synthase III [Oscillospiraceae bacterium]